MKKYTILIIILSCSKMNVYKFKGGEEDRIISVIKRDDFELFKIYFRKLKNINFVDLAGNNLLHLAAKYNRKDIQDFLILNGVSASIFNNECLMPDDLINDPILKKKLTELRLSQALTEAVKNNKLDVLDYLLDREDLSTLRDPMGNYLIHKIIIYVNRIDIFEKIIEKFKNKSKESILNILDENSNNLLHILASSDKLSNLIKTLQECNSENIFNKNNAGDNFIATALKKGNTDLIKSVIKEILDKKPEISIQKLIDEELTYELLKTKDRELIEILMKLKFPTESDEDKKNSFLVFLNNKKLEFLYLLIDRGLKEEHYEKILVDLVEKNSVEEIEYIANSTKLLGIKLKDGNYLIHKIINKEMLAIFIEKDILDLSVCNYEGKSLLEIVAKDKKYSLEFINYILSLKISKELILKILEASSFNINIQFSKILLEKQKIEIDSLDELLDKLNKDRKKYIKIINLLNKEYEKKLEPQNE